VLTAAAAEIATFSTAALPPVAVISKEFCARVIIFISDLITT